MVGIGDQELLYCHEAAQLVPMATNGHAWPHDWWPVVDSNAAAMEEARIKALYTKFTYKFIPGTVI